MMDSIALAKAIELQTQAREERWRRNEDLFYHDYSMDPPALVVWAGRLITGVGAFVAAMKKADRRDVRRSACDDCEDTGCDQAASCRA
ncbi:hypothetical protein [Rhizobium sp. BR 314]|uniref:hypothetical protein n=1 Tax=Rhizobium sp. BR 314 TaxID=3040013 RepID=UPI0039BED36A